MKRKLLKIFVSVVQSHSDIPLFVRIIVFKTLESNSKVHAQMITILLNVIFRCPRANSMLPAKLR